MHRQNADRVGKTKTLVEMILQIINHHPTAHILACAPSNTAADVIARRLAATLTPTDMFRLNGPSRTFAEVNGALLPYCHIEDDKFGLPAYDRLMRFPVIVCGMQDSRILTDAGASNGNTMRGDWEISRVIHPTRTRRIEPHWTHLIVDEVSVPSGCA